MRRWLATLLTWGIALIAHRAWSAAPPRSWRRGVSDAASHAASGLATVLPITGQLPAPGRLLAGALVGSLILDLDHVAAARSLRLSACMTMPSRPATHSAAVACLLALVTMRRDRALGLGLGLGLGAHLVRDLATGGAPLLTPKRSVSVPEGWMIPLLAGISALGWLGARRSRSVER
jgi:hypothetical protein